MKTTILSCAVAALAFSTDAAELSRDSVFASFDAFTTAVKAFQPATSKGDLSSLFAIADRENDRAKSVTATAIQSCDIVWSDDESALVFAIANPPTTATHSSIAVLFLLIRHDNRCRIGDFVRFTATGKEAQITAELTAFAGSGRQLGSEGFAPVITVKASHGGRGYSYQTYASYTVTDSKIKRLDMK